MLPCLLICKLSKHGTPTNSIPNKPLESYIMTHEEEELQYEISKLRYQVQQISILQRATEDGIDGLKSEMEDKLVGLKDQ